MNSIKDTIISIATPKGSGGIAVLRLSGNEAISQADKLFVGKKSLRDVKTHNAAVGVILDKPKGNTIDKVVMTIFRAPNSYTGEDVVEISCHGGTYLSSFILDRFLELNVRLAEPGEFTKRAFLNDKIDLAQAEAVADLIHSKTRSSLNAAINQLEGHYSKSIEKIRKQLIDLTANLELELDFAEEDITLKPREQILVELEKIINDIENLIISYKKGRLIHDGVKVAITGKPNVGKSSLFNALLGYERAIVDETPGTTRDTIDAQLDIQGSLIKIFDTAGLRNASEKIEKKGISITEERIKKSDIILFLMDCTTGFSKEDEEIIQKIDLINKNREKIFSSDFLMVWNKIDLKKPQKKKDCFGKNIFEISAKTGVGLESLHKYFAEYTYNEECSEHLNKQLITNVRHYNLLKKSKLFLVKAKESCLNDMSNEFIALDLRTALDAVGEIIGKITTDDILNHIFANFCIGK